MVGFAQTKVAKEYLVELVIVVLACVYEYVFNGYRFVEAFDYFGEADYFRAGADDGEDFEFLHLLRG